jgi:hypothetical protein
MKSSSVREPAVPGAGQAVLVQELADDGRLPRFLEQEAVVAVGRLDHMALGWLAELGQRVGDLDRRGRRVEPVGAERDQQRPRRHPGQSPRERAATVLPREIEVGQRARGVQVGVGVEAFDERVGLVAQVALDLELRLGDGVADVVARSLRHCLEPPAELVV